MIVNGKYTSVWDGEGNIETKCKVNTKTHRVFNIKRVNPEDYGMECEILDSEYVEYNDGDNLIRHQVLPKDEIEEDNDDIYWRD